MGIDVVFDGTARTARRVINGHAKGRSYYLRDCPFCGQHPTMKALPGGGVKIECVCGGTDGRATAFVIAPDENAATARWNRRRI